MKFIIQILTVFVFLPPQLSFAAYDWEAEEGNGEREIQITRNRTYPGGADEQDLKVQKFVTPPSRSPETIEIVKRADAEPDDHGPTE